MITLGKFERWIVVAMAMIVFGLATYAKTFSWLLGQGDTAFLSQVVENIAERGRPVTQLNGGINGAMPAIREPAEKVCQMPLAFPTNQIFVNDKREVNQFSCCHTYLILYLLAPLNWLFSIDVVLGLMGAFSFVGLLLLTYLFLRSKSVSPLAAALFSFLVSVHPAWSYSIQGQPYSDRLFLVFGFAFAWAVTEAKVRRGWVVLWSALALSVVDRTGVMCGAFLGLYTFLYWDELAATPGRHRFNLVLAFTALAISAALVMSLPNPAYERLFKDGGWIPWLIAILVTGFGAIAGVKYAVTRKERVRPRAGEGTLLGRSLGWLAYVATFVGFVFFSGRAVLVDGSTSAYIIFALANLAFLGGFLILDRRLLCIGAAMLIPNIHFYLNGWVTHYDSTYFPFLVWASASAFAIFYGSVGASRFRVARGISPAVLALPMVFLDPHSLQKLKFDASNWSQSGWYYMGSAYVRFNDENYADKLFRKQFLELQRTLPKGIIVSTTEAAMPSLYKDRELYLYPMGIDVADRVVLFPSLDPVSGKDVYQNAISFMGAEEQRKINECANERMAKMFDMDHPVRVGPWAIFSRLKNAAKPAVAGGGENL